MLPLHTKEMKPSALVQAPQAQPVLPVEDGLIERQNLLVLARAVELKVGGLLGVHNVILVEHDHHKVDKFLHPGLIFGVLVLHLIVDGSQEVRTCRIVVDITCE